MSLINTNVNAVVELTHSYINQSIRSERKGVILNVGSVVSFFPRPSNTTYAASKAFIKSFTEKNLYKLSFLIATMLLISICSSAQKVFSVDYASQAKKKIFFVDYSSQADLKIFFVDYGSQAGWKNKSKSHLMY